jgi:HD-like signal output (HDOD) protein
LNKATLPSPPAVAMQIVQITSRPDVSVAQIVELLRQDPAICVQVLKAINSSVFALAEPVTSIERAVLLLGLNTMRSIVLTMSLPAMRFTAVPDRVFRDFWLSAVSGAVIARELSVRMKTTTAEEDLLCGLLRDLGQLVIHQSYPAEFEEFARGMTSRPFSSLCEHEREVFGVDHAEVSAELLRRWNLPVGLVQPIRAHHQPELLGAVGADAIARCERLGFVDALTNLDVVAHQPGEVDALLARANDRYGLSQAELVEFLQQVVPKVEAFTALLSIDVGRCPDFAMTLTGGCQELLKLTVESGKVGVAATMRTPPPVATLEVLEPSPSHTCVSPVSNLLPEFVPEFLDDFPSSGCTLDDYELHRELGRGAMGVVFQGYEPTLDRVVAIKMMNQEVGEDSQSHQRFIREARNAAAIRHENVVAIYAVKERSPLTYLCMEYVPGESLEDLVRGEHPLPVAVLRTIATQITAGLAAAHACKVIHRDVKPANILIESRTGRVKLTDFGLARSENDVRITLDGSLIGTPLYMSPEQAAGKPLDHRSDLFSLGAVLYTAATGKPPFDSNTVFEVLRMVNEAQPVPPRQVRPDLPDWFDRLVLKLMAKNKGDRYASADEVLTFLNTVGVEEGKKRGGWRRLLGIG